LNMQLLADVDGVSDDAFASRLAPTVEGCRPYFV
jgi:two-component system sensor histidine kinase PfeS